MELLCARALEEHLAITPPPLVGYSYQVTKRNPAATMPAVTQQFPVPATANSCQPLADRIDQLHEAGELRVALPPIRCGSYLLLRLHR